MYKIAILGCENSHADAFLGLIKDGKYTDGLPPVEDQLILGDIINGTVPGRANEEEFVITSCHGIALSDVAVGDLILQKAKEANVGITLPFMREMDLIF